MGTIGKNFSKNIQNLICNDYSNGISSVKLGEKYNLHSTTIRNILHNNNIITRLPKAKVYCKYTVNEDYFNVIDTEEKAYILGFIYADGCNHIKRNVVAINIQEGDIDILQKIKTAIGYTGIITFRNGINNRKNHVSLRICNLKISNALTKLGCIANKSLILKFPTIEQIPYNLLRHFIRGYFDGDGCIYIKTCTITSSTDFCNSLQKILDTLNIKSIVYQDHRKTDSTKTLVINRIDDRYKFLNYLYEDSTIHMNRKYNKYLYQLDTIFNKTKNSK